jgi:hypothetical protein
VAAVGAVIVDIAQELLVRLERGGGPGRDSQRRGGEQGQER